MTEKQASVLRFIRRKERPFDEIAKHMGYKSFEALYQSKDWKIFDDEMLNYYDRNSNNGVTGETIVSININGLNALEQRETERRRWLIPVIISIIALILSTVAILVTILQ